MWYGSNLLRVVSNLHDGVVDIVGLGPLAEDLGGAPLGDFCTHVELMVEKLRGDTSGCGETPVDFKTKVMFWPSLSWPGKAKVELMF